MTPFPIRARAGNALAGVRLAAEDELGGWPNRWRCPPRWVAVCRSGAVLMIFDSGRRQWEWPGGSPGNPRAARAAEVFRWRVSRDDYR